MSKVECRSLSSFVILTIWSAATLTWQLNILTVKMIAYGDLLWRLLVITKCACFYATLYLCAISCVCACRCTRHAELQVKKEQEVPLFMSRGRRAAPWPHPGTNPRQPLGSDWRCRCVRVFNCVDGKELLLSNAQPTKTREGLCWHCLIFWKQRCIVSLKRCYYWPCLNRLLSFF